MDNGDHGNNHHNFHDGADNRLSAESLPLIDTRLLSQSELRALSHCSSLSPSSSASLAASAGGDDDLTPKIDRSVFNESAGSRKQTFLRLRLARHPQPPEEAPSPQRQRDDSSLEEQTQVASLLRSLFNVDSIQSKEEEDEGEEEVEENEGQIHYNSYVYQRPNLDSVQNVLIQGTSGNEIKRKRGRPRKIRNPSEEETEVLDLTREASAYVFGDKTSSNLGIESRFGSSGISMDSNLVKRKRGRPPKNKEEIMNLENRDSAIGNSSALDKEELVKLENREGAIVDLSALASVSEDPYEEELKRITVGLKTKEEILGFLEQLNGEWVNIGKKKKVVRACDYGGYLPRGWKLMLYIKKKGSNLLLACRRYISPDGQQFETCNEVSTYLRSLLESPSKNRHYYLQSDNRTLGQQPVTANDSSLGNSDSMDLPVPDSETMQYLESGRTGSEVFEEAKVAENGDEADGVKTSLVEKDANADFLNGDDNDHTKKRDGNMENLAALSKAMSMPTDKLQQYFNSQIH
ncbi:Methyl-CpG DNA binding [Arabidopsis thaliana x Arabidopsis arenosa]|uniref:Methyl-CpG DNA binding n=1 Tax=Arabidopsis thaliana x Arabidopsis arenosa TaxID=1240361 RepID=A0A8T2C3N3_9BRAS|nr:Methyl-CpG DNA binding [Arabidopsis thaliana x Arabidopsis arenosa]